MIASSAFDYMKLRSGREFSAALIDRAAPDIDLEELAKDSGTSCFVTFGRSATPSAALKRLESIVTHRLRDPLTRDELSSLLDHIDVFANLTPDGDKPPHQNYELVGSSQSIRDLLQLINRVAPSDSNVLISGEPGTGKAAVARSIHNQSDRSEGPFVAVNCSAIPPDLLESELFGQGKTKSNGATSDKNGRFALAAGGTLFLEDIGDMPPALQAKLLLVLNDRVTQSDGCGEPTAMTARLLAATHQDIEERIERGLYREDLYSRLNAAPLQVPSLRERKEDIPQLVREFARRVQRKQGFKLRFTSAALDCLQSHDWPGNVRELANLVECMAAICPDGVADVRDLPLLLKDANDSSRAI